MSEPTIFVDDRSMGDSITLKLGAAALVCILDEGDFAFWGKHPATGDPIFIGVEHKTVRALTNDIKSHRVMLQAERMAVTYQRYWLMLMDDHPWKVDSDGFISWMTRRQGKVEWESSRFLYSALDNFLVGIQERGMRLKVVDSDLQAARSILNLYAYYQKDPNEHDMTGADYQAFSWDGKVSLRRKVAAQVEGLGWSRSHVAEQFPSVRAMVMADSSAWIQASASYKEALPDKEQESWRGIGKVLAERIVESFGKG